MDQGMNPFGEDRIMESLASRRNASLDDLAHGLLADIRGYVDGAEQYDDMTFLFMRVE
ncbi:MAG: hypothetical protein DMF55_06235 [Acidobacteria bacterium]|nr:MAG: hypothetical protein DMF55_06235 [Acidobacteriota bacterium]